MFKRKKGLWRRLRNLWHSNENACYGCGDTWSVDGDRPMIVYGKTVNDGNMSPLCRECFDRLTTNEILFYCEELVRLWRSFGSETRWSEIKEGCRNSVEITKAVGELL